MGVPWDWAVTGTRADTHVPASPQTEEFPRPWILIPCALLNGHFGKQSAGYGEDAVSAVCPEPHLLALLGSPLESVGNSQKIQMPLFPSCIKQTSGSAGQNLGISIFTKLPLWILRCHKG